jgi:hypothetical protein
LCIRDWSRAQRRRHVRPAAAAGERGGGGVILNAGEK